MEEKKEETKEEKEAEMNGGEKMAGMLYILHTIKERFKLTKIEQDTVDYCLYLVDRERRVVGDGELNAREEDEEEDEVENPNLRIPGLLPGSLKANMEVAGYA